MTPTLLLSNLQAKRPSWHNSYLATATGIAQAVQYDYLQEYNMIIYKNTIWIYTIIQYDYLQEYNMIINRNTTWLSTGIHHDYLQEYNMIIYWNIIRSSTGIQYYFPPEYNVIICRQEYNMIIWRLEGGKYEQQNVKRRQDLTDLTDQHHHQKVSSEI